MNPSTSPVRLRALLVGTVVLALIAALAAVRSDGDDRARLESGSTGRTTTTHQDTKPFAAGSVEIDAGSVGQGSVAVTADPLPGFSNASVTVTGSGGARVSGGATGVPAEGARASTGVSFAESASSGDPAEDALADANGSKVVATLTATGPDGTERSSSDTVWAERFRGRTIVSERGELDLRLKRVEVLKAIGEISAAEAVELTARVKGGTGSTNAVAPGTCAAICVQGTVLWTDSAGGTHPVQSAPVEIREDELVTDEVITTAITDANGNYSAVIDNDDGVGEGDRDVYVRVLAAGPGFDVQLFIESTPDAEVPDGSVVTQDLTANNTLDNNTAFSVQASLVYAGNYLIRVNGSLFPTFLVDFPTADSTSNFGGGQLHILQLDRFDWDVNLHEYGHFVADQINIQANPGGDHSSEDNLSDSRGSKDIGVPLAWGEGWATFFGVSALQELNLAAQNIPLIGDSVYNDTEDQIANDDLEADNTLGEDNENTVASALWDLFDAQDDGLDTVTRGSQPIWNALKTDGSTTLSEAYAALSPGTDDEGANCIFTQMNVAPRVTSGGSGLGTDEAPSLTWTAGNGGPFPNDSFVVEFRNAEGTTTYFTSPTLTDTTYTPSADVWREIQDASGGDVFVTVVGSQTEDPQTGPYRSCTLAAMVGPVSARPAFTG